MTAVPAFRRVPWNPLACSDTPMRPHTLLIAKLSWLLLVFGGYAEALLGPVTPAVGLLSVIPGKMLWLATVFWIGGAFLIFNRAVRGACLAVGGAVLLAPLESVTAWHAYAWVCGSVLLLCATHASGDEPRFVRWFTVLIHVAALLGAIAGAGWIETALAAAWDRGDYLGAAPRWLARLLPEHVISHSLHWGTIVLCTAIPIGLLVPRWQHAAAALALSFYTLLYFALGATEVLLFGAAIGIAQISFLVWPRYVVVLWPRACGWPSSLRVALDRFDFERRTDWPRPPDPDAELEAWFDVYPATGARAIVRLVLVFPAFYFALLIAVAVVHALLPRFVAVPMITLLALTLLGFGTFAAASGWRTRLKLARRKPPVQAAATPAAESVPTEAPATEMAQSEPEPEAGAMDVTDVTVEIDTPPRSDP